MTDKVFSDFVANDALCKLVCFDKSSVSGH